MECYRIQLVLCYQGPDVTVDYYFHFTGSGKTMLMDLFYDTVELDKKKRVHFNSFMLDVHNS